MNVKGSKHLTLGERIAIAELLVQNKSLLEISKAINKDARTITKEIKRNRQEEINKRYLFTKGYPEFCKRCLRFPFVCIACEKNNLAIINTNFFIIHNMLEIYKTYQKKQKRNLPIFLV